MKIKKSLFLFLVFGINGVGFAQNINSIDSASSEVTDTIIQPIINFTLESFDLSDIPEDTTITRVFTFTNEGTDSLTILGVSADCSCTVPEYTEGTFAVGEKGYIKVTYNSKGNAGRFIQYVTVLHNAGEGYTFLTLKGFVVKQL